MDISSPYSQAERNGEDDHGASMNPTCLPAEVDSQETLNIPVAFDPNHYCMLCQKLDALLKQLILYSVSFQVCPDCYETFIHTFPKADIWPF